MATHPFIRSATVILLFSTLAVGSAASAVETKIMGAEGKVTFSQRSHPHPHAVSVGQSIAAGDTIMTAAGARAAIGFAETASTAADRTDLILLGPDTKVEILTQTGEDMPPMLVRVISGSYRAQVRNGRKSAHFTIAAGDRVVHLDSADTSGTYSPATNNATFMCREGSISIAAGKRRIKVAAGMSRVIDGGRILGARKMTPDQWRENVAACTVPGIDVTMPVPPDKAALAQAKDGKFELVLTPDGVLPKTAVESETTKDVLPTTQGQLDPPAADENEFEYVRMTTSEGDIILELDRTNAPISTANFLQYVDDGFYDGTIFHRVISNFMIQGGGFNPGMQKKQTRPGIKNEWQNGLDNDRGTIAMARLGGQADSATSQFFINVVDNTGLDSPQRDGAAYAVFGRVIGGMDVVDAIRNVRTTTVDRFRDVPAEDVVIESVERTTKEALE